MDSQILSVDPRPAGAAPVRPRLLVFDACHVGVVLRTLIGVVAVMAVAALYGPDGMTGWLAQLALLSGAAVPGTLAWLVAACALKQPISRLPAWGQQAAGIVLGALAGLFGCWLPAAAGLLLPAPWLAAACTGAGLAAAMVGALRLRAKARAPADAAARLSELQARIRPHFLFNALNTAIALVQQDPARAEAVLEDLSDLFRHALAEPGESVTLDEEVDLARRYLAIEQARFGPRLRVDWAIDPGAGAARVPPLLLQPLVENAVKHGVEPSEGGADLRISTERRGSAVVVKVINTVPAGQGQPGLGLAQDNVRDRLALLHDVQAHFATSLRDGVYQVRLELPL